jgi:hypothetical protein
MDLLTSVITKLQDSHVHLTNKEVTLAKLLIKQSIEELKLCMADLESVGTQTNDVVPQHNSNDPARSILAP